MDRLLHPNLLQNSELIDVIKEVRVITHVLMYLHEFIYFSGN